MAQILPHPEVSMPEVMAAAQNMSNKGAMKAAEAHARVQDEILKETYLLGYTQCMKDFGLNEESKRADD